MVGAGKQVVQVDGRRITLTNLDKVLYPSTGWTKGDVLAYFAAVAPALIPLAAGRPATRKRWPEGVGASAFFAKRLESHAPDWVARGTIAHRSGDTTYPIVDDVATLTWLAQQATLEVHTPQWRFAADGTPAPPDRMVLDLDPGEGTGLDECAAVALLARPILLGMGLDPLPITSGSKGLHVVAALDGTWPADQVAEVAHELARALEADHPDLVVSDMKKQLRVGRVLVDWSQNRAAKTTLVPYSLRGTDRPAASAPRTWEEIGRPGLAQLTPDEVVARLRRDGDLLAALAPGVGLVAAAGLATAPDALDRYRAMRDARRTPEPVPSRDRRIGTSGATDRQLGVGTAFVIQEHHARRLHWDLRLERDGVLVSWALPKGVPVAGSANHLAVHTEDHPLDYATFAGDIPHGEYGGGHVDIWDSGTFVAEKFRDDEVIATLTGRPDGGLGGQPVRIALIRTARDRPTGTHGEHWLIHRMAPEADGAMGSVTEPVPRHSPTGSAPPGAHPAEQTAPMLATADGLLAPDDEWAIEMKWDGIRAIAHVDGDRVHLRSRNGVDLTATYPELQSLTGQVHAERAVLDGEIVAPDRAGRPSFSLLQRRMGLTAQREVEAAMRLQAVRLLVFDVLAVEGTAVLAAPWQQRRALLERLVDPGGAIDVPPVIAMTTGDDVVTAVQEALDLSLRLGLEGVVAKRTAAPYRPGARSRDWVKRKHARHQTVVVGGWRPGHGAREGGIGSLLLGVQDGDALRYVGRVGTGFTDEDLHMLAALLRPLARPTNPLDDVPRLDAADAHWVTPSLVGEVRFAEWTGDGRLRQAAWRGLRPDTEPGSAVREP